MSETLKALQKFRDTVVNEAKANLRNSGKSTSGKLLNSIEGTVKEMPNSIGIYFDMLPYGNFQDKGVNGMVNKHGAPYSFRKGFPNREMLASLDKWIVKKGLAPRTAKGTFTGRLGLKFAIAKSIFKKGIKPSLFFTKPFEAAYKQLPDVLIDKYGLDAEQLLNQILDTNLKNIK
jgi:hypothetical protein